MQEQKRAAEWKRAEEEKVNKELVT